MVTVPVRVATTVAMSRPLSSAAVRRNSAAEIRTIPRIAARSTRSEPGGKGPPAKHEERRGGAGVGGIRPGGDRQRRAHVLARPERAVADGDDEHRSRGERPEPQVGARERDDFRVRAHQRVGGSRGHRWERQGNDLPVRRSGWVWRPAHQVTLREWRTSRCGPG